MSTGDVAEPAPNGQFILCGRSDRIVKVEEKRLSLPEMEQRLGSHPWIADCAITVLDEAPRDVVATAIVLSPDGVAAKATQSERDLRSALSGSLHPFFERVVLPRRWRFVSQIPENSQGKRPKSAIQALFSSAEVPSNQRPTEPIICSKHIADTAASLGLRVPLNLLYFQGHFDEISVVAGVVQLHWVMLFAHRFLGVPPTPSRFEAIKFHQLLLSDTAFTMDLAWKPDTKKLHFKLRAEEQQFASGRVVLDV